MMTQELLHELFDYKNGQLIWREDRGFMVKANAVAGSINKSTGYIQITINKKVYRVHRMVFLYHYGWLPKMIDHIDRNKHNNKIENLRPCNAVNNQYNSKLRSDNTSGVKGVSWHRQSNKWLCQLRVNGRKKYIGRFDNLNSATNAISKARDELHGDFANHIQSGISRSEDS